MPLKTIKNITKKIVFPQKELLDFKKELELFPKPIRVRFKKTISRLKKYGLNNKQIIKEIKFREREIMSAGYLDPRFDTVNKKFIILKIMDIIDQILDKEKFNPLEFKKIGRLIFDVNGLKMVNDLKNHEAGDEFLRRIAEIFKNGKTTNWLNNEMNIKTIVATEGGDEFSVLLIDNQPIDRKIKIKEGQKTRIQILINLILDKYHTEIKQLDVSDILDFKNDKEVRKKIKSVSIPPDFQFKTSVSGGKSTLYQAWRAANINFKTETYKQVLNKIASIFFNISDATMRKNKEKYKKKLGYSKDPKTRFLSLLYQRSGEYWDLERENQELKQKIRLLTASLPRP